MSNEMKEGKFKSERKEKKRKVVVVENRQLVKALIQRLNGQKDGKERDCLLVYWGKE